jgi:hypothetical protein
MSEPERSIDDSAKRHQTARPQFREPERGSKVAHSTGLLHVGGPFASTAQLVASIREGQETKQNTGSRRVLWGGITSTNGDWYDRMDRHDEFGTGRS